MRLLAQNIICFGPICPGLQSDATGTATGVITNGIRLFLIIVALFALMYGLWGAFDYVISEGDKEKVSKAQKKMQFAFIGVILTIVMLAAFGVIAGDILGILVKQPGGGWRVVLPSFF